MIWIKLLKSKYTYILLLAIGLILLLNLYTNGKIEVALTDAKNKSIEVFNEYNKQDKKDVEKINKDNNSISDDELNNSLCGGKQCPSSVLPSRVDTSDTRATGLPVYTKPVQSLQTTSEEQQRQSESIYEEVFCTEVEAILSLNGCYSKDLDTKEINK